MILVDANLLLYGYDQSSSWHRPSKTWLEKCLMDESRVGLAWVTILAFLRITTHPRLPGPISLADAIAIVNDWLSLPSVVVLSPGERHWEILSNLLPAAGASGPLVMDAHLAALAIEHGATLCTNDRDSARFPGLKWMNPLPPSGPHSKQSPVRAHRKRKLNCGFTPTRGYESLRDPLEKYRKRLLFAGPEG